MNILGISCYYHDSAAALLQDGVLVAAAQEERFTRVKHDAAFPARAIAFCLQQAGITREQLDYVVFYEKPVARFERIVVSVLRSFPRSSRLFSEAMISWFDHKLWVKSKLLSALGVDAGKVLFVDHHVAHAASAFFCSPFRQSAMLTIDGVGEWTTAARGVATADWDGTGANRISLTEEMSFPHSLGLLYSAFTAWLGFEVNEGEYKVMGMAPYGRPRYLDKIGRLAKVAGDGSLRLDLDYFSYQHSPTQMYNRRFVDLFGEPRPANSRFITRLTNPEVNGCAEEMRRNQEYADVAASIQTFTEETVLKMASALHESTGMDSLCLAGGVALNSVTNGRLLRETGFKHLYIHPAAGDSGGAAGAALYAWHVLLGKPRRFVMDHAYLGEEHSAATIEAALRQQNLAFEMIDDDGRLCDRVTDMLTGGKVVGWFQGRFEWGPRALGNRSILADPRRAEMKDVVNTKIKFREPFRPFAPVMTEEAATRFFEAPTAMIREHPARFMLLVLPWEEASGSRVPAVNHLGTGRLQTLRPEWNPRYHRLLETFEQAAGVPVLMNTSFNLRGEPIVASPQDALNTFFASGLDGLVMGHYLVTKPN